MHEGFEPRTAGEAKQELNRSNHAFQFLPSHGRVTKLSSFLCRRLVLRVVLCVLRFLSVGLERRFVWRKSSAMEERQKTREQDRFLPYRMENNVDANIWPTSETWCVCDMKGQENWMQISLLRTVYKQHNTTAKWTRNRLTLSEEQIAKLRPRYLSFFHSRASFLLHRDVYNLLVVYWRPSTRLVNRRQSNPKFLSNTKRYFACLLPSSSRKQR